MTRVLLCLALAGCSRVGDDPFFDGTPDASPPRPALSWLGPNLFTPRCATCHTGGEFAGGLMDLSMDLRGVTVGVPAMGGPWGGGEGGAGLVRIGPGRPGASLFYTKTRAKLAGGPASPCGDPMPQGDDMAPLVLAEVEAIGQWIADGAQAD